jgi:hypothetical protein
MQGLLSEATRRQNAEVASGMREMEKLYAKFVQYRTQRSDLYSLEKIKIAVDIDTGNSISSNVIDARHNSPPRRVVDVLTMD